MDPTLLPVVAVGLAATVVVLLLLSAFGNTTRRRIVTRIQTVQERHNYAAQAAAAAPSLRRRSRDSSFKHFDTFIKRFLPRPEVLRQRLMRTGKNISIGEYVLACLALGAIVSYLRGFVLPLPTLPATFVGIIVGVGLPHLYVSLMIKKRIKAFLAVFPDAIELIIRGVRSGLPVPESIRTVASELPGPVGQEFRTVADKLKLGQPLEQALLDAAHRIGTPEFKFFVISISVQRETGGNLAETLENLADLLRKRRQMVLKIKAMSSEARASAMILGSLPFIMFTIMYLLNKGYIMTLFNDPRGVMMVIIGLTSMALGVAVMAKMVKFEI
ncbi:MAG: type II secretion system F family protein [Rhodospirillales bacterium]